MTKILNLITDGMVTIADSYVAPRDYVRPTGGFQKDHARLRSDVVRVGQSMNKAIAAAHLHGKQSNKNTGRKP